mmetsp:Transcript_31771/g.37046  ORF Transcript_31771/g.37046 Transcript_31771/m.37046 type:complete len:82 (-) Transcript_31771:2176-2421(-)
MGVYLSMSQCAAVIIDLSSASSTRIAMLFKFYTQRRSSMDEPGAIYKSGVSFQKAFSVLKTVFNTLMAYSFLNARSWTVSK